MVHTLDSGVPPTGFWLGFSNFPDQADCAEKLAEEISELPPFDSMSAAFLSRVPYTLGVYHKKTFGKNPDSAAHKLWKKNLPAWQKAAREKIGLFLPLDVVFLFDGLFLLNYVPPEALIAPSLNVLSGGLDSLEGKQASSLLFALNEFKIKIPNNREMKLKDELLNALIKETPSFSIRRVAKTPPALLGLGIAPTPAFWSAFIPAAIKNFFGLNQDEIDGFMALVTKEIDTFNAHQIATLPKALADLGIQPSSAFWKAYYPAAAKHIDSFGPNELVSFYKPYPRLLASVSEEPHRSFLKLFLPACQKKFPGDDFVLSHMAVLIRSFAASKTELPAEFLDDFYSRCVAKMERFSVDEHDHSSLVHAPAKLGLCPPDAYLLAVSALKNRNGGFYTTRSAINVLWSYAAFSVARPLPKETLDFAAKILRLAKNGQTKESPSDGELSMAHLACRRLFPGEESSFPLSDLPRHESPEKTEFLGILASTEFKNHQKVFVNHEKLCSVPGLKTRTDCAFLLKSAEGTDKEKTVTVLLDYIPSFSKEVPPLNLRRGASLSPLLMTPLILDEYKRMLKRKKVHTSVVYVQVPASAAEAIKKHPQRSALLQDLRKILPNLKSDFAYKLKLTDNAISFEFILCAEPPSAPQRPDAKASSTATHAASC